MFSFLRSYKFFEPVAYVCIQCAAYIVDFGTFMLVGNYAPVVLANISGKMLAGGFAFVAHRYGTFLTRTPEHVAAQAAKYIIVLSLTTVLSSGLLRLAQYSVADLRMAKLGADTLTICISFLIAKRFVFRDAVA